MRTSGGGGRLLHTLVAAVVSLLYGHYWVAFPAGEAARGDTTDSRIDQPRNEREVLLPRGLAAEGGALPHSAARGAWRRAV